MEIQIYKYLNQPNDTFPVEVRGGDVLPHGLALALNECPVYTPFSVIFFHFFCFLLVILLFKMSPRIVVSCYLVSLVSIRRLLWTL